MPQRGLTRRHVRLTWSGVALVIAGRCLSVVLVFTLQEAICTAADEAMNEEPSFFFFFQEKGYGGIGDILMYALLSSRLQATMLGCPGRSSARLSPCHGYACGLMPRYMLGVLAWLTLC